MTSSKNLVIAILLLGVIAMAWYIGFSKKWSVKKEVEQVSVVLDKIERVVKLVTVEGHISEIYDHKDYYTFDFGPFRKKALIRVNAKVSAGYDFSKMQININQNNQTIKIINFPEAEILSVDHDLDYYDITQGTFNQFSNEDYNKINKKAKSYITAKAVNSHVLKEAELHKDDLILMIAAILADTGWKLEIEGVPYLG